MGRPCRRCHKQVSGTGRWLATLSDGCAEAVVTSRGTHDVQVCPGGRACTRCALPVRGDRRDAAPRARCPVPLTEPRSPTYEAAYRFERGRLLDLVRWARPAAAAEPAPQAVPPPPPGFLPSYRGHTLLAPGGTGHPLCIKCGVICRGAALRHGPCQPRVPLPSGAVDALRSHRYDPALAASPAWVIARAEAAGWSRMPSDAPL